MAYNPTLPKGQALMAESAPVVLSSNQSAIPVTATNATAANLKVESTIAATQTLATVTSLTQMNGQAISMNTGVRDAGTQRVTIATNDSVPVTGTVTANIGTSGSLNLEATQTAMSAKLPATLGQKTMANALAVSLASDQSSIPVTMTSTTITGNVTAVGAAASGAAKSGNPVQTGGVYNSTQPTVTTGQVVENQSSARGELLIAKGVSGFSIDNTAFTANAGTNLNTSALNLEATQTAMSAKLPATLGQKAMSASMAVALASDQASIPVAATLTAETTKVIGQVSINQTTPGTTNAVQDIPATSGGLLKTHVVSAASTNATIVKASAGQVYGIVAFNLNASPRYLKFHNTSGTPTAGTGVTDTYMIPGNTAGAGLVINFDKGIAFSTGIGITLVTGIADADTTGVAASEIVLQVYYK